MKIQLLTLGLTAILAVPIAQGAFDGSVRINYSDASLNRNTGGSGPGALGGEFRATIVSGLTGLVADANNSFLTFCLERDESLLGNNVVHNAIVSNKANFGGAGGPSPDPISLGTAYLYSQFRNNQLLNPVNTDIRGGLFQEAIWALENEVSAPLAGANMYYDIATALANYSNDANGAYGVVVLQLYGATEANISQDVLAIVPEPSTVMAGALLLLPFAASTIRILRKKREA
jgi:hypothetical protein